MNINSTGTKRQCDILFGQLPPETKLYYLPEFNEQCMPQDDNSRWFFTIDGTKALNNAELQDDCFDLDPALLQSTNAQEMRKNCDSKHSYLIVRNFRDIKYLRCEIEVFKQLYTHLDHSR